MTTIKDTREEWEIRATETPFVGNKTSVRTDEVVMPDGSVVRRDYQVHPARSPSSPSTRRTGCC